MKALKTLIILLLFFNFLNAEVKINAPLTFIVNKPYVFEIIASGNEVNFPKIEEIQGNKVELISSVNGLNVINSKVTRNFIRKYSFIPTTDFTIPSFKFVIDNKEILTTKVEVKKQEVSKTFSKYADFELTVSKASVYVSEEFRLKLKFKYLDTLNIKGLNLAQVNFDNFWYKQTKNQKEYKQGEYYVHEMEFLVFAQKSGTLNIEPFEMVMKLVDNSSNDFMLFNNYIYKSIYSNKLTLEVKELPQNIKLVGEFNIDSSLSKTEVTQGDAVSFKVKIDGFGNIDDIDDIKLDITEATIYENKPTINTNIVQNRYFGTYEKVFSIIPNKDMVIKPITIKYFDKNLQKVVEKSTPLYKIKVIKQNKKEEQLLLPSKKQEVVNKVIVEKFSYKNSILFFLLGVIFTLFIIYLYKYAINLKFKKQKESNLLAKIKNSKTKNELIKIVIVFLKVNETLDKKIFQLQDISDEKDFKTLKKEIYTIIKNEKGIKK
ncbi:BatD family protein [Malaciobacter mytili]|uniref:BatD family protein n=1 Tax=Malaciobacter mytili TaxID=603050 RepID=UPI003BAEB72A